ncbi:MAG: ChbG/HpnK family deacetylase [Actinomycetota bacterium]|nr:ChbG/HpnK family deacetylase [Actinomycetota bacterium]
MPLSDAPPARSLLIVNADDWGGNRPCTDAIAACFTAGSVTSATAMVHMADSRRAAGLARERALPIGLHLNLVEPFDDRATPAPVRERQRRLVRRLRSRRVRYWIYDPSLRADVEGAIADQLECFRALYATEPTHVDGHEHAHLLANVLLARTLPCGIKLRTSAQPRGGRAAGMARSARGRLIARRFCTPDYFFALRGLEPEFGGSGLEPALELASGASVEVMVHPGAADELALLQSRHWLRCLADRPLGSYAALAC